MTIVHEIKDDKNFSILCTCPVCLKSLITDSDRLMIVNNKMLLANEKETKRLIIDAFNDNDEEYNLWCPHCKRFNIIYKNKIPKWKWAEKTTERYLPDESNTRDKPKNKEIEGRIEES